MPGIKCNCGNVIKYGEIPNPNEFLIISDNEYDKYSGLIDSEDLYKDMKSILQCNVCKRLWIFWGGFNDNPQSYLPEV